MFNRTIYSIFYCLTELSCIGARINGIAFSCHSGSRTGSAAHRRRAGWPTLSGVIDLLRRWPTDTTLLDTSRASQPQKPVISNIECLCSSAGDLPKRAHMSLPDHLMTSVLAFLKRRRRRDLLTVNKTLLSCYEFLSHVYTRDDRSIERVAAVLWKIKSKTFRGLSSTLTIFLLNLFYRTFQHMLQLLRHQVSK